MAKFLKVQKIETEQITQTISVMFQRSIFTNTFSTAIRMYEPILIGNTILLELNILVGYNLI